MAEHKGMDSTEQIDGHRRQDETEKRKRSPTLTHLIDRLSEGLVFADRPVMVDPPEVPEFIDQKQRIIYNQKLTMNGNHLETEFIINSDVGINTTFNIRSKGIANIWPIIQSPNGCRYDFTSDGFKRFANKVTVKVSDAEPGVWKIKLQSTEPLFPTYDTTVLIYVVSNLRLSKTMSTPWSDGNKSKPNFHCGNGSDSSSSDDNRKTFGGNRFKPILMSRGKGFNFSPQLAANHNWFTDKRTDVQNEKSPKVVPKQVIEDNTKSNSSDKPTDNSSDIHSIINEWMNDKKWCNYHKLSPNDQGHAIMVFKMCTKSIAEDKLKTSHQIANLRQMLAQVLDKLSNF